MSFYRYLYGNYVIKRERIGEGFQSSIQILESKLNYLYGFLKY